MILDSIKWKLQNVAIIEKWTTLIPDYDLEEESYPL